MRKKLLRFLSISLTILLLSVSHVFAQDNKSQLPEVDKSPLDESYCPANYPLLKLQDKVTEPLRARVIYSRPQANGRVIFGNLVEYSKVWRLGANEATEIEFYGNATINNVKLKKGRYSIYAIPEADSWTFILNKETDSWGSFRYSDKTDIVRMKVPVTALTQPVEAFSMYFTGDKGKCNLVVAWENVQASLPISFY